MQSCQIGVLNESEEENIMECQIGGLRQVEEVYLVDDEETTCVEDDRKMIAKLVMGKDDVTLLAK